MRTSPSLRRSLCLTPHKFDLSNHQPTLICYKTKKLMKTIIRLAKLTRVADPQGPVSLKVNCLEELEVLIRNFLYLVHRNHFPLLGVEAQEEWQEEQMDEEINEWMGGWVSREYHPLLSKISVHPQGFADHDVEPNNYGNLVALLYWLGGVDDETPKFRCSETHNSIWSMDERNNFKLAQTAEILAGTELKAPLNHLSGLIKTVLHQTDTFFLDACPLCADFHGPNFDWTVENFIWFRDDWLRAKPIYDANQELIKWSGSSSKRLTEISIILKRAQEIHLFYKDEILPEWC